MPREIPAWAMRAVGPEDDASVRDAQRRGALLIKWPDLETLRGWARRQGWPTPWFGFKAAFFAKMLESRACFELAVSQTGIEMQIPRTDFTLSAQALKELDALYQERSESGRPVGWNLLVEELREIRRAVEAGVVVTVEGRTLRTWQEFYDWAHGRYHMLEDGCDHWIGDDKS